MIVPIQLIDNGKMPTYATEGAAALDCYARTAARIGPNPQAVPLGFALALPEGYFADIRPRSGLALKHRVTVTNSPGTIDSDYRGEVAAILHTLPRWEAVPDIPGRYEIEPVYFDVKPGDRICQLLINRAERIHWREMQEVFGAGTTRGTNGFGSTGQ